MNQVRRVRSSYEDPQFPHWENPANPAGFIIGALLWILMLVGFLFLFYVQLFALQTRYLLRLVKTDIKAIPFWFSVLMVVFLFPFTLAVILLGAVIKLLKD
ncbi:hypothetical protein GW756_05480 [bacterium]|nr:hypothetical protein [bacterium]NCQ55323.1 hypothetical protein [Candidatus Parcubacteria bacterium]NCS67164.1 hypothetical protein [Candidatus Peregrinibacteria bacterium]NCS96790.1 hypothetical protein [bacterium]